TRKDQSEPCSRDAQPSAGLRFTRNAERPSSSGTRKGGPDQKRTRKEDQKRGPEKVSEDQKRCQESFTILKGSWHLFACARHHDRNVYLWHASRNRFYADAPTCSRVAAIHPALVEWQRFDSGT